MTKLVVWDGNLDKLPESEIPFLYKDKEYYWEMCPCGCDKPLGFLGNEVEKRDFEMTVRLRGVDQADPIATVLVKLGLMEELIATNGDNDSVLRLLDSQLVNELKAPESQEEWDKCMGFLASKGISEIEWVEALDTIANPDGPALVLDAIFRLLAN